MWIKHGGYVLPLEIVKRRKTPLDKGGSSMECLGNWFFAYCLEPEVVPTISDTAVRLLVMIITSCKGGGCDKYFRAVKKKKKLQHCCGTQLCFIMSSHPGEKWDYS